MWLYQNKQIQSLEDIPTNTVGFVYKITNLTNDKFYIGKKQLQSIRNVKLGKKEKKILDEAIVGKGRRPSKKRVITESNWLTYYGSSKSLLKDIQELGEDKFKREILHFCSIYKQMSYYEHKFQFQYNVLENPEAYNDNIGAKWYYKDIK